MAKSNVISMLHWAETNRHKLTQEKRKHTDTIYLFSINVDIKGFNDLNMSPYTEVLASEDPLVKQAVETYKTKNTVKPGT